ncbi:MAG: type II secretion system minor pseudopilin GspI [Hyphomonadaceae bacterium]
MSRAKADSGFSIVEALVALAVFASAGVGLIALQTQSARTLTRVETRALGAIVAQNTLTETLASGTALSLGTSEGETALAGRAWRWRLVREATQDAGTLRVSVVVTLDGAPAAEAHGFAARGAP